MRHRFTLIAIASLLASGLGCLPSGGPPWSFPPNGSVVDSYEFEAVFTIEKAHLDPAGTQFSLNGEPAVGVEGPAGTFSLAIEPGFPLRDKNLLEARVPTKADPTQFAVYRTRFFYLPPGKARAFEIADGADLIEGPLAHNRQGDFMLENDVARFVVQAANRRDLHSVGQFGGNLIDAELRANPGKDNFFEIQPAINIETVINATSVVILNDGQDGLAAIVESCGPDDLIDYINASSQVADFGVNLPGGIDDFDRDVSGCTQYVLEPRRPGSPNEAGNRLWMDTTIFNHDAGRRQRIFPGEYLNGMGELEQFTQLDPDTSATGGGNAGIGELLAIPGLTSFSYFGFGEAEGVSYGRIGPLPDPAVSLPDSSFSTSGVSFVLANNSVLNILIGFGVPTLNLARAGNPGDSGGFSRVFLVGSGSVGEVISAELELNAVPRGTLSGCVTVGGVPAPGARVTAGPEDPDDPGVIRTIVSTWVADAAGCYEGEVPADDPMDMDDDLFVTAAREGTPYEGGGMLPALHPVPVPAGGVVVQDIALPATGRLRVEVEDPNQAGSAAVPARVTVVGFDPSPEPIILFNILFSSDGGTFKDVTKDPLPYGISAAKYTGADGIVEFDLEPGDYQAFVSRGTEYSRFDQAVSIAAGATTNVAAEITRVLETPGFISSDYHVHSINSPDSRINLKNRVEGFAGEGVENYVATDHDARTDPNPTIQAEGLTPWLAGTIGEEITTFDTGHYNGYPLGIDPVRPSGGSTDWARPEAVAGMDFPIYGAFNLSPAEIHAEVLGQLDSFGNPQNTSPNKVVQINHIGSHFSPLQIDTSQEPPRSFLDPGEPEIFRLDPSVANFFHHFPALELWNGSTRGAQGEFLEERIGIWMNLLNQGMPTTFIADTDTHTFLNLRTAGARTWTASPTDEPSAVDSNDVGGSVLEGRATGGQGVYVQTHLREADTPANEASFGFKDSTLLDTAGDPNVVLVIHVQAPVWAEFDTVEIYANAETFPVSFTDGTPVQFDAVPTQTLVAGTDWPPPPPTVVDPGVPGAARRELHLEVPFTLAEDTWFVVVVKGTDGVSEPMFPIYPSSLQQGSNTTLAQLLDGNLGENGTMALGATNALYADVDGNPGFDAPGVRLAP